MNNIVTLNWHNIMQINALFMVVALRTLWKVKRDQHQKQSENKFQASLKMGRLMFNRLLIHIVIMIMHTELYC